MGARIADVAFVSLTFASGIVANVELSWLAQSKLRRTVLVGSDQSLCLGGHEVSLQHEDIDSQLIEFSRPDERRELAAV